MATAVEEGGKPVSQLLLLLLLHVHCVQLQRRKERGWYSWKREEFEAEKGERTLMEIPPPLYSRSQMDGKRGGGGGGRKWTQGERK